ncbi:class II fructose-bisphosphatase [Nocardioides sp. B-3]|uniref:class II fructose-bisphosphatase n=1 Tax=Nocardioides sp. B-3 TaxID=2895565 RepID=UPI002152FEDE|nr:class II fructose-bisphosphatase [Nocardioides sp. B-3]UUZ59039.1 class II fructose-bisphosphatase [Nocardioides sp. B-3]
MNESITLEAPGSQNTGHTPLDLTHGSSSLEPGPAWELARVTRAAAVASAARVGRGDKNGADGAAVAAMRHLLGTVAINGTVVIGEGEKDDAPMLFNGERVGSGGGAPACDLAVDPIDGTRLTANGLNNALSIVAIAERGAMYDPSAVFYMEKLVTGPEAADVVDISAPAEVNIRRVAKATGRAPSEITVAMLDRPRHEDLVREVRRSGARLQLLMDGDVAGAIAAARTGTGIDLLLGIGGTPEGTPAACAIRSPGGVIRGRLWPQDERERARAVDAGHDLDRILTTEDLVSGRDVIFVATGVTDGDPVRGVRRDAGSTVTHSVVMHSRHRTVDFIESTTPTTH